MDELAARLQKLGQRQKESVNSERASWDLGCANVQCNMGQKPAIKDTDPDEGLVEWGD